MVHSRVYVRGKEGMLHSCLVFLPNETRRTKQNTSKVFPIFAKLKLWTDYIDGGCPPIGKPGSNLSFTTTSIVTQNQLSFSFNKLPAIFFHCTQIDILLAYSIQSFFNSSRSNQTLFSALNEEKVVLFLHLLGIDTNGHAHRPYSK